MIWLLRMGFWFSLAASLWCGVAHAEQPQQTPAPYVAVIEQQDAQALSEILDQQIPPRWQKPIVEWVNKLIARQKQIEDAKAAPSPDASKN